MSEPTTKAERDGLKALLKKRGHKNVDSLAMATKRELVESVGSLHGFSIGAYAGCLGQTEGR